MNIEDEIARALRDFLQPEGFEIAESDRVFAQRLSPLLNRVRAEAWRQGHAAGRDYQGDGWNCDAHDPEGDNPYIEQNSEGNET